LRLRPPLPDAAASPGRPRLQAEAKGLRYRVEDLTKPERAAHVASRLKPRLASASPARLKPHLRWSKLERRGRLAAALRRCEYTVSRHDFRDLIGEG
jgi:hypothetical protein